MFTNALIKISANDFSYSVPNKSLRVTWVVCCHLVKAQTDLWPTENLYHSLCQLISFLSLFYVFKVWFVTWCSIKSAIMSKVDYFNLYCKSLHSIAQHFSVCFNSYSKRIVCCRRAQHIDFILVLPPSLTFLLYCIELFYFSNELNRNKLKAWVNSLLPHSSFTNNINWSTKHLCCFILNLITANE